uniref:ABC3 transporter permease C-terminal domain-containing protein n=1 Tax=Arcella intermedia TaxID=1963864 RepID=A0A6B2KXA1_9EUKA
MLRLLQLSPDSGDKVVIRFDFFSLLHTVSGSTEPELKFIRENLSILFSSLIQLTNASAPTTNLDPFLRLIPGGINIDPILTLLRTTTAQGLIFDFLKAQFGISVDNLKNATNLSDQQVLSIKEFLSQETELTVSQSIVTPKGKYPNALGNAVVIEFELWNRILRDTLENFLNNTSDAFFRNTTGIPVTPQQRDTFLNGFPAIQTLRTFFSNLDMREFSLTTIVMYKNRFTTFMKDKDELEKDIINWSNQVVELMGLEYPVMITAPLIQALRILYYLRLFLDQLLLIIELFLVALGMLLIYSLLLADVEGKVYECGMLRALGMHQVTLIQLLVVQSLLFSVPGIVVGLILSNLAFIPIGSFFSSFSGVPVDLFLTTKALGLGVFIGFIMPLVALIGPVQRSLSKSLRDALDLYHSLSSDTLVTFVSLEKLGISATQTYVSILGVSFGFIVYYMIPYSFIFFYWALFFNIFVIILMAMVLGLALLGMVFHPLAQTLSVNLLMWGPDRKSLKPIVQKNLSGHGRRNSKTAILFTICISFIIFSGTIFNHQAHTLTAKAKIGIGADIVFASLRSTFPLDRPTLAAALDKEMKRPGTIVKGYTFSTFPLSQIGGSAVDRTDIGGLADFALSKCLIYGVDENFLDITYDEFVSVTEYDDGHSFQNTPHNKLDLIRSITNDVSPPYTQELDMDLYSRKDTLADYGYHFSEQTAVSYGHPIDIVVSEATRLPSSLAAKMPVELKIGIVVVNSGQNKATNSFYFMGKIRAMSSSFPGFLLSSYSQTAYLAPVIVSMKNYKYLQQVVYNHSYLSPAELQELSMEPPTRALYIKVEETASIQDREDVINALKIFIQDDLIFISNTKDILQSTDTAILILNVFFYIVALIIITLCFFLLFVSFTTNVNENAWEFGVLRAIGMTAFQVLRVYIYEAMSIVLASVLIGFFIGDLVSVTLALQSSLFSELPFTFEFPTILFCGVVGMSILVAILGSYLPARVLQKKRIAAALKNL